MGNDRCFWFCYRFSVCGVAVTRALDQEFPALNVRLWALEQYMIGGLDDGQYTTLCILTGMSYVDAWKMVNVWRDKNTFWRKKHKPLRWYHKLMGFTDVPL